VNGVAGWALALVVGLLVAWLAYPRGGMRGLAPLLAVLRCLAVTALLALMLDLPIGVASAPVPLVAFDASASWLRSGDTSALRAARDSAGALAGRAAGVLLFGDTVRSGTVQDAPVDEASRVEPLIQRAVAAGRRVVIVTDGALEDAESLSQSVAGSRLIVIPTVVRADRAVADITAPAEAQVGDTITLQARISADGASASATSLRWMLGTAVLADVSVPPLTANGEAVLESHVVIPPGDSLAVLTAALVAGSDAQPRNDTAAVTLRRGAKQRVVIVSTSPDADVRDVIAAMRKNIPLPTQAFFRVAPGRWVRDGNFTAVDEATVRAAVRGATVAVLHGDSAAMGAPSSLNTRALLLLVPPVTDSPELLVHAAPASPLQPALAGIVVESLPPLSATSAARGGMIALAAAPGGIGNGATPIVALTDGQVRRVLITAAGYGRWRTRGGVSEIAFQSLIGGATDWLLAARGSAASAVPVHGVVRAGSPFRWQPGVSAQSVVTLVRDGDRASRRDTLMFAETSPGSARSTVNMRALPQGIWRGTVDRTPIVIPVSASREWLPRTIALRSGLLGGDAVAVRRGARALGWLYLATVLILALEWLLRRRAGLR
jgi:CBS domain-containing protein